VLRGGDGLAARAGNVPYYGCSRSKDEAVCCHAGVQRDSGFKFWMCGSQHVRHQRWNMLKRAVKLRTEGLTT
jgi:hypothetical protein